MKTVLLISIENINNAGDELLRTTTQFLLNSLGVHDISRAQFYPRYADLSIKFKFYYLMGLPFKVLAVLLRGSIFEYKLRNICYIIQYKRYFSYYIKQSDCVIYTIGMLKYSTQNCSYIFDIVNRVASKLGKPVMMSAMSIESIDSSDGRARQLVRAVNMSSVRAITTRDGADGLLLLRRDYIKRSGIKIDDVGDPALWIKECYGLKRHFKNASGKILIGIGLVRSNIYKDYTRESIDENFLLNLYGQIISECTKRGYDWVLFCNGISDDYSFGRSIVDHFRLPSDKLLSPPHSGQDLIDIVSRFDCVFGARLHACITAVALNIPVVGLLWDSKFRCFAKNIGISNLFIRTEDLTGSTILDRLEAALSFNYDLELIEQYKDKTVLNLKAFIDEV